MKISFSDPFTAFMDCSTVLYPKPNQARCMKKGCDDASILPDHPEPFGGMATRISSRRA
jgi:hypothetical protein